MQPRLIDVEERRAMIRSVYLSPDNKISVRDPVAMATVQVIVNDYAALLNAYEAAVKTADGHPILLNRSVYSSGATVNVYCVGYLKGDTRATVWLGTDEASEGWAYADQCYSTREAYDEAQAKKRAAADLIAAGTR